MEIIQTLHQNQWWFLQYQVEPKRWGRYKWMKLLGLTWEACFRNPHLLYEIYILLQMEPSLLMCKYCAKHFYLYQKECPVLPFNVIQMTPYELFDWICKAFLAVQQKSVLCKEQCVTQLWLQERNKTTQEWFNYFNKKLSNPFFYKCWQVECLIAATTMLRCLPKPERWTPLLVSIVQNYISALCNLMHVPKAFSLLIPKLSTSQEWTWFWKQIMICKIKPKLTSVVFSLVESTMKLYKP
jgi:hypothetical protein